MTKTCSWKSAYGLFEDGNRVFNVECNDNPLERGNSVPNNFCFTDFKYCPYCGRRIKWIRAGGKNER